MSAMSSLRQYRVISQLMNSWSCNLARSPLSFATVVSHRLPRKSLISAGRPNDSRLELLGEAAAYTDVIWFALSALPPFRFFAGFLLIIIIISCRVGCSSDDGLPGDHFKEPVRLSRGYCRGGFNMRSSRLHIGLQVSSRTGIRKANWR